MSFKHIVLFLGVLLCAQLSLCNVIRTKESEVETKNYVALLKNKLDVEDTSSEKILDERSKLMVLVVYEFYTLADAIVTPGKKLLKDVITEVGILNNSDGKPYPLLVEIKEFVEKMEKIEKEPKANVFVKFELFGELSDLLDKLIDEDDEKTLTTQDKVFIKSLKKNGLNSFETEFMNQFEAFMDTIYTATNKYWTTLSDDEKVTDKKIGDWLIHMKQETDKVKRIDLFSEFFDLQD